MVSSLSNPFRLHLYNHPHFSFSSSQKLIHIQNFKTLSPSSKLFFFKQKLVSVSNSSYSLCCFCKTNNSFQEQLESVDVNKDEKEIIVGEERASFDINLAVILAGFSFEAYSSPPENVGTREFNSADCQTVYLSELFLREVYDGQLLIKLRKGVDLPAMDPWGTSDPYVIMQLDGQVVKSNVKWAKKDPTWDEEFTLNIKIPTTKSLQVKYRSFDEVDERETGWKIPYISDFLANKSLESTFSKFFGSDTVKAQQFVQYAFGQLRSLNHSDDKEGHSGENSTDQSSGSDVPIVVQSCPEDFGKSLSAVDDSELPLELENSAEVNKSNNVFEYVTEDSAESDGSGSFLEIQFDESMQSDMWKNVTDLINQNVVPKLGFPVLDKIKFDGFDMLNKIGLQCKEIAEAKYVESGLATPGNQGIDVKGVQSSTVETGPSSSPDIRKLSFDILRQTDSILGAVMVFGTTFSQQNKDGSSVRNNEIEESSTKAIDGISGCSTSERDSSNLDGSSFEQRKADDTKALFSSAESAMEAWAMLATSLGHPSFIKSEFEKICFLENTSTDTQVAIWRDTLRRRLVVAFRGTEQSRWKDLLTDLMLVPAGLNPERVGGDFKQEIQVHSGFLSAYDSVRTRLMSLIKLSIGYLDDGVNVMDKWHIYATGHSLGGALATLLTLELSSSQMAKNDAVSVTMYNFGSPRVGNKRFVDLYNEKVKDSWRIVNHRDIIPTVPRLMGYCHVAQPVYLATGDLQGALENMELLGDGYHGDVIAEYTPDVLVGEFMKGEKELLEKILQTEINIFRSIRDGSALMQHMEDFYYITLLEHVRSNYKAVDISNSNKEDSI
ncbi:hypothetical protein IFM89_038351 [Coptis chinensis]|uniref:C2 domain-containing protein n=1 Tax=Coptis chinensis TaxID=261450 RepID=A0A835IA76_9MAGN|nr:hypothetical protein IFM89_038351 [Coptis chinensis]